MVYIKIIIYIYKNVNIIYNKFLYIFIRQYNLNFDTQKYFTYFINILCD